MDLYYSVKFSVEDRFLPDFGVNVRYKSPVMQVARSVPEWTGLFPPPCYVIRSGIKIHDYHM